MRGYRIILPLLLLAGAVVHAQVVLEGEVFIHNSLYRTGKLEPVEGALVSAPFATTEATNRKGKFRLQFAELDLGNAFDIGVEREGLEVVNPYALKGMVIGRESPIRIFMAEKGQPEAAQQELMEIGLRALNRSHDALVGILHRNGEEGEAIMDRLEEQFGQPMESRFEAEQAIGRQRDRLKEWLPEMAKSLAQSNLDFASDYYRKAYEWFRQGEMEQAIAILDDDMLQKEGKAALASLLEGEKKEKSKQVAEEKERLLQAVHSFQLKAQAELMLFRYQEAWDASRKAASLLENAGEEERAELASAYTAVALSGSLLGEYEEALHYQQMGLALMEHLLGSDALPVASYCSRLAAIYKEMEDYPLALEAQQRAVDIRVRALPAGHPDVGTACAGLARIHHLIGDYRMALETQQRAISIQETGLPPNHPSLGHSYHTLAEFFMDEGAHMKALEAELKALFIQERSLSPGHPDILRSYDNLALIYLNLGDYEKAMEVQKKIISLQEHYLPAGHPDIGTSYHNLASTCYFLQDLDNALLYEQKGYDILQAQLPAGHPHMQTVKSSFAFLYSTRGERRQAAGQYEGAIEDLKKALEFRPDSEETKRRIKQIEAARGRGVKAGAGSESFALSSKGSPEEQPAPAEEHFGFFRVTKATSLREGPTSSSKVLRRLSPGDSLRVLEKTEYYWWKVDDNGKVGYVKALLLEQ